MEAFSLRLKTSNAMKPASPIDPLPLSEANSFSKSRQVVTDNWADVRGPWTCSVSLRGSPKAEVENLIKEILVNARQGPF